MTENKQPDQAMEEPPARPQRAGGAEPALAPAMVGREPELARLVNAYETAVAGRRLQAVTLTGEPGMGKTRLLREFQRRLDEQARPYILFRGWADPGLNQRPHALLREMLGFRFKIRESDPPRVAYEKLVRGVEEWLGSEAVEAAHWMGHLAGFEFARSTYLVDQLDDPRRARRQAFQCLRRFLCAVAARSPVLILLDDVQWADNGSLDGLEALARSELPGPILMVALARPELYERRPGWGRNWPGHMRLDLPPLSRYETVALAILSLRAAMGYDSSQRPTGSLSTLPAPLTDRVAECSGGNPFFIQELVQNFFETGVLVPVQDGDCAGAWRADLPSLARVELPASLPAAFEARLDHLPAGERRVLTRAAVIGQVFWEEALACLLEAGGLPGGGDIRQALEGLLRRGLIFRREISSFEHTDEYVFRSALLRGLVYESIPLEERRQEHARAAGWLVSASANRRDAYAAAVALHYEQAGMRAESAEWYGRAAQQARRTYAPEAAVRFYLRALDLLPDEAEHFDLRAQMCKGLWEMQWWLGRYSAALATGKSLLAAAEARGDEAAQATAWNRIAAIQIRQDDTQAALHSVQRAERLARAAGHGHEVVLALFNRGLALDRIGNATGALRAGQEALAYNQAMLRQMSDSVAEREAAAQEAVRILSLLGMIHRRAGRYSLAEEDYRRALEIYREQDDRPGMVMAYNHLGANARHHGDYRAAVEFYQEAFRLSEDLGPEYRDLALASLNSLAGAQVDLGQFAQAEALLRTVIQLAGAVSGSLLGEAHCSLAQAALWQGRYEDALRSGLRALELARQYGASERLGSAWRVLGMIAARGLLMPGGSPVMVAGKQCDAHACFAASLQAFVEMGNTAEQARTAREWAAYELIHGDPREGERLWQEAREIFARLGMMLEMERMDRHPIARDAASD